MKLLYSADGVATPVTADANGLEVQVSNASIAGTAGSPGSSVLSVQGITSMTPVQVTPVGTITKATRVTRADLDTGGKRQRWYLIWIEQFAPGQEQVEISEVYLYR